jgi:hypothetical protein
MGLGLVEIWRRRGRDTYNPPMRLVGRILVVLAVTIGPAVVTSFGCNVDGSQFPGLPNEIPNHLGGGVVLTGSGGATTTTTVSSTSGSGSGGATGSTTGSTSSGSTTTGALSVCDCAAALNAGSTSCVSCQNAQCVNPLITCQTSTCNVGIMCVLNCAGQGPCVAGCIENNPAYATFLACMFTFCAPACGEAVPLTCPLPDGGADASAD